MMENQELFKQAILDAKAVRETAMAAARTTLAEHFEPFIKETMVKTLSEEEGTGKFYAPSYIAQKYGAEKAKEIEQNIFDAEESENNPNLWDLFTSMESAEEVDDFVKDFMSEAKHSEMDEATLEEILAELNALSEDMEGDLEEGHVKSDGYDGKKGKGGTGYNEKAKVSHGDHKLHEAEEDEDEEDAEKDDKAEKAGMNFTKDMEAVGDEQEVVDITVGDLKDIIRDVFMQLQGGADMGPALDADTDLAADLGGEEGESDEISLDEILAELEEESKVEEGAAAGEIPGGQIDSKAGDVYKVEQMKKELNEAVKTIKTLKTELNEINLFSAKLLYVNKIFKAKNLSEAQKTKVINAFDRAESVKEVENTYRTLLESVSAETKKSSLKESVGFASKPIGHAPARPIVEADAFVSRWQQLAGIK
jgi:hypothetical protein